MDLLGCHLPKSQIASAQTEVVIWNCCLTSSIQFSSCESVVKVFLTAKHSKVAIWHFSQSTNRSQLHPNSALHKWWDLSLLSLWKHSSSTISGGKGSSHILKGICWCQPRSSRTKCLENKRQGGPPLSMVGNQLCSGAVVALTQITPCLVCQELCSESITPFFARTKEEDRAISNSYLVPQTLEKVAKCWAKAWLIANKNQAQPVTT